MRLLLAYGSEPHYMAPPRLVEDQINCGPYFQDRLIQDRWTSLATLGGSYDLAKVARRLPASQQPDLIVVHVDGASMAGVPRNLAAFRCPKVLLVADTHHGGRNPIASMIRYARSEPFDRIVLLYDRHHLDLFRAAGFKNLHWLPSLTFAHSDARVAASAGISREARIAIVGTTGYHPRRLRLFSGLVENKLPLDWREIHQSQAIEHYAGSLIGLNASMNGDLNMRTFEILAGGALLLTDRLAPASGLYDLLKEDREFVAYETLPELIERARHLLAHPAETQAMADAGARWFREHFSERRRREAFLDVAFNGRDRPEFALPPPRIQFKATPSLGSVAGGYHWLQVRHQKTEAVRVVLDGTAPKALSDLFVTLPRVTVAKAGVAGDEPVDLAVVSVNAVPAPDKARNLWLWDVADTGPAASTVARLAAQGWHPVASLPFLFTSEPDKPKALVAVLTDKAREHFKQGDISGAFENATSALKLAPDDMDALCLIVDLSIEAQNWTIAGNMLARAEKKDPHHPQIPLLRRQLEIKAAPRQAQRLRAVARLAYDCRDHVRARHYAGLALEADANCADAHHLVGLIDFYHAGGAASPSVRAEAVASLHKAVELSPQRADYQLELALACHELHQLPEAIAAYRRALQLEPSAYAWQWLGRCLLAVDSFDEAAEAFRQALILMPGDEALTADLRHAEERSTVLAVAPGKDSASPFDGEGDILPPELSIITKILGDKTVSEKETSLQLCDSFARIARQSPTGLRLPSQRTLMAYQPWFGIDTPTIVTECLERGRLIVLFSEKTKPSWQAPDGIHAANFRALVHRGVNLWEVSRYRLALTLRKNCEGIDPAIADDQSALQGYYGHAVALIDKAWTYFDCYRPDTVVIAQGYDIVSAVLRYLAIQKGLRVVSLENIFRKDRLLWEDVTGVSVNQNLARNYYWRHRNFVSEETARASVETYLNQLKSAKAGEHASPVTPLPENSAADLPTITYLAQVGTDSSVLFGLRGFESQVEVIAALAAYAASRQLRLLVKLHPKENPAFQDEMTAVRNLTADGLAAHPRFAKLRAQLGERLVIDDANRYDTYDLIRRAQVCVTINSQAGLEAAILGKEVVLCGDAFYGSLGFTHEATDARSLEFTLDRVLNEHLRINHGSAAAKFYHIFTELYCQPKTHQGVIEILVNRPKFRSSSASEVQTARAGEQVPAVLGSVDMNSMASYRNRHQGQRCFVVGGAPSLKHLDLTKLEGECLFTVNRGYLTRSLGLPKGTYHVVSDPQTYQAYAQEVRQAEVGQRFYRADVCALPEFHEAADREPVVTVPFHYAPAMDEGHFAEDPNKGLYRGFTVVLDAVQLAFYMGFTEVYIIGCDLDYSGPQTHVYTTGAYEERRRNDMPLDRAKKAMAVAEQVFRRHGRILANAGVGGQLDTIPRVAFDALFSEALPRSNAA